MAAVLLAELLAVVVPDGDIEPAVGEGSGVVLTVSVTDDLGETLVLAVGSATRVELIEVPVGGIGGVSKGFLVVVVTGIGGVMKGLEVGGDADGLTSDVMLVG